MRTSLQKEEVENLKNKPPDNFRDIPTFPNCKEIHNTKKPFLRPAKKIGCYNDDNHYLDVQYRLLREDLVSPLREGIQEVVRKIPDCDRKHSLKVYNGVKILHANCTNNGLTYRIMFDTSHTDRNAWKYTRRLIFGSLVCLSKDDFKTMIFATITNRNPEDLHEGLLDIRFTERVHAQKYCRNNDSMVMVETPSYFEAYKHVLDGMKEIKSIPLHKYIVKCKINVCSPRYIGSEKEILYDLSRISNGDEDEVCQRTLRNVAIMKQYQWPDSKQTNLNKSQLKAFMHALTEEFTMIQGPPGSGKTHVGLHIADALLQNKKYWNSEEQVPMLIVCYTNHALDQFLKGLIYFGHENIIRVGGRACEELKIFNLKNAIRDGRYSAYSERIRDAKNAAHQEKEIITEEITPYIDGLKTLYDNMINGNLLNYEILMNVMPRSHQQHLSDWVWRLNELRIRVFDVFLGLYKVSPEQLMDIQTVEEPINEDSDAVEFNAEAAIETIETIEIEGEGDMLTERWAADVNAYKPYEFFNLKYTPEYVENKNVAILYKDGTEIVQPSKEERKRVIKENLQVEEMCEEEAINVIDPWQLDFEHRWGLYRYWVKLFITRYANYIEEKTEAYENACETLNEIYQQEEELVLRHADVIAMTTTCAAKYRTCLHSIKPKVVIIEEAAEVLEAHVIASLSDGLEHLVLVGDQKQLKPNPAVYELAKKFSLDVSLFERMINNGMPFNLLDTQHRMRPGIARLLRHVYPQLNNHLSVLNFPNVLGVDNNVLFINHRYKESDIKQIKSKSNIHEAEFMKSFCLYLIQQGYKRSQITILTGYTGQLIALKNIMPRKQFEGVRVTVLDNYQGEENDIILLSLVRSNSNGKLGFMKIENRICVALSRAKIGLFVIGNFDLFEQGSPLWKKILKDVRGMSAFKDFLTLRCQNHPHTIINIRKEEDFLCAPEGGCTKPCDYRLNCGHVCHMACHPLDKDHERYSCKKLCNELSCEKGHRCHSKCHYGQDCEPCQQEIAKTVPKCLHVQVMKCCEEPEKFICQEKCSKIKSCGHHCLRACGEACDVFLCKEKTLKQLKPCGHEFLIPCFMDTNLVVCNAECYSLLDCLHRCRGTCGKCKQGRLHVKCSYACTRLLVCSHLCNEPCTSECPPCRKKCENCCTHSACKRKCGELCTPCMEPCQWRCKHFKCRKKCSEICDRCRCNEPCLKKLKCGHRCIGLCGETCPALCRICHKNEVEEVFFGTENDPQTRFLVLSDCKHMFEVTALDRWMEIESRGNVKLKECPKCKTPIRRSFRYGNIVKIILNDIDKVKEKIIDSQKKFGKMKSKGYLLCKEVFYWEMDLSESIMPCAYENGFPKKEELRKESSLRILLLSPVLSIRLVAVIFSVDNLTDVCRIVNQATIWKGIWMLKRKYRSFKIPYFYTMFADLEQYLIQKVSRQQYEQILMEYKRLQLYLNTYKSKHDLCKLKLPLDSIRSIQVEHLTRFLELFEGGEAISADELDQIDSKVKEIRDGWGLRIFTVAEKVMVLKGIGLGKGHWFKCEEGHVYAIGECGGAMERGTCPECGNQIGGTNHALAHGNTHASEFDDSQYAAYSNEANNDLHLEEVFHAEVE